MGRNNGNMIFEKAPITVVPSISAASSKDSGICLVNELYIIVENGITAEKYNTDIPWKVSVNPRLLHITINGKTVTVPGTIVENNIKTNANPIPRVFARAKAYPASAHKNVDNNNTTAVIIKVCVI